jgi:outer membrane protein assembly factor BamB
VCVRVPALEAIAVLVMATCGDSDSGDPPTPSFDLLFPPVIGDLMTISSPNVIDLDGDGALDIVFGTGVERVRPSKGRMLFTAEPDTSGYVVAVSGATNHVLWRVPAPRDAFTTPRFAQLNADRVPDVLMGGREGVLSAFSGVDGAPLWRVVGKDVAATSFPYNFLTPALIKDANNDGVTDLIAIYGGDDTKPPNETRAPSYVSVISGRDGSLLKVFEAPDGKELYASPVVYERPDGKEWLLFGTGGETQNGAMYRVPVAALLDGSFAARAQRLVEPGTKGVIAPATLVELTGDRELDIVISTFDGRLVAVDGALGTPLWQHEAAGEETYHSAAVLRLTSNGDLGLFVSRGIGAFPKYVGTVHRLHDAADGRVLYEYRDPHYPAGAPLAVDLTGDGVDEPIFFSTRFPSAQGSRIHVLHLPSRALLTHDLETNYWTTPIVADVRGRDSLELIGLSWRIGENRDAAAWRDLQWQLLRMDLTSKEPIFRAWAGYMGTFANGLYQRASVNRD